jgi:hypothetical protein
MPVNAAFDILINEGRIYNSGCPGGKSDRRDIIATRFACRQIAGPAQRDHSAPRNST